jgi:hydrogenase maturation protein HypF
MGRLFDGAAALLGLSLRSSYEGEAAMLLENSALEAFKKYGIGENFGIEAVASVGLSAEDVLLPLAEGLRLGESREVLAAQFHLRLVRWAERMAAEQKVRYVVCSGGVFQNGLLADLISDRLSHHHTVLFHRQLSPNDESIALGQLMLHQSHKGNNNPIKIISLAR